MRNLVNSRTTHFRVVFIFGNIFASSHCMFSRCDGVMTFKYKICFNELNMYVNMKMALICITKTFHMVSRIHFNLVTRFFLSRSFIIII